MISVTGGSLGSSISINGAGGLTYIPGLAFQQLAVGETASDTVSYTVSDGQGGTATQDVVITITGENDAPTIAAAITASADEDDPGFSVDLLAGASDIDTSDTLNVTSLVLISGDGSGIVLDGNSLSVDPSAYSALTQGQSEIVVFSYLVDDGNGGQISQTATVTINGIDVLPLFTAQNDVVDFNLILAGSYIEGSQYDGLAGDDNVVLAADEAAAIAAGYSFNGNGSARAFRAGEGDDIVVGGSLDDNINGQGGNDTLRGNDGNDRINGGDGDDVLEGGNGADRLLGLDGNDVISGGDGNDTLEGWHGDNTLSGGNGDDSLQSASGDDLLMGGDGNDTIVSSLGENTLEGGLGDDLFVLSQTTTNPPPDFVSDTGGVDTVEMQFNASKDSILEKRGDDLYFEAFIPYEIGVRTVGSKTLLNQFDGNTDTQIEFWDRGTPVGRIVVDISSPIIADSASITFGTSSSDLILGSVDGDHILADDGNDAISSGEGNDTISATNGSNLILAGAGDDSISGGGERDEIAGQSGNDTIYGGGGDDSLAGDFGDDIIFGGLGEDTIVGGRENDIIYDLTDDLSSPLAFETGTDQLYGGLDDDIIFVQSGDNKVGGSFGDDEYVFNLTTDQAIGASNVIVGSATAGKGYDTLRFLDVASGDVNFGLAMVGDDLIVSYTNSGGVAEITIQNQFVELGNINPFVNVETIEFSDSVGIDISDPGIFIM